uniref:Uncharacterized protein n=1 Tax=Octopus bimaculoides TaxID=37653 RepID=A0A0L8I241_OCTBM
MAQEWLCGKVWFPFQIVTANQFAIVPKRHLTFLIILPFRTCYSSVANSCIFWTL